MKYTLFLRGCGVLVGMLLSGQSAVAFDTQGHIAIERRALALLGKLYGPPTQQAVIREVYKSTNADWNLYQDWPKAQTPYPDMTWERQFSPDLQAFHFMASNRAIMSAARLQHRTVEQQLHQSLLSSLPDCLQLMRFLMWEACYSPKDASKAGRGIFVLLHVVSDSYSSEHTGRAQRTGYIEVVKGWRVARPAWPRVASAKQSSTQRLNADNSRHQMVHGGFHFAPGDKKWQGDKWPKDCKGKAKKAETITPDDKFLSDQAEQAARAEAVTMYMFFRARLEQRQLVESSIWDAVLTTYLSSFNNGVLSNWQISNQQQLNARQALTQALYQAQADPGLRIELWNERAKNTLEATGLYSASAYAAVDSSFYRAFLTIRRASYENFDESQNWRWHQFLADYFWPAGNHVTQSDTAFEFGDTKERIVFLKYGEYDLVNIGWGVDNGSIQSQQVQVQRPLTKQEARHQEAQAELSKRMLPVKLKNADDYDYHTNWTALLTTQLSTRMMVRAKYASIGVEGQYHWTPGSADHCGTLWRRFEYGVAGAVKMVPYQHAVLDKTGTIARPAMQASIMFAPNLVPLPYFNGLLQGRFGLSAWAPADDIGPGAGAEKGAGIAYGFDMAWNLGPENATHPACIVVGYEHNDCALLLRDAINLKIGWNTWHTRRVR